MRHLVQLLQAPQTKFGRGVKIVSVRHRRFKSCAVHHLFKIAPFRAYVDHRDRQGPLSSGAGDAATSTESIRTSVKPHERPKCPLIDMLYAAQRQQCVELVPVTKKEAHSLEADALYCGVFPKNDPIREALTSGHSRLQQLTAQNLKLL